MSMSMFNKIAVALQSWAVETPESASTPSMLKMDPTAIATMLLVQHSPTYAMSLGQTSLTSKCPTQKDGSLSEREAKN